MKVVGRRSEPTIAYEASGVLLARGARANDELSRFPGGEIAFIPKGVYRFRTLEEADRHRMDCLAEAMSRLARSRT